MPFLHPHRRHCLTPTRNITLCSWHPGHTTLTTPGPHQPTSALTPSQPHRPMELRVSWTAAFTPALTTARTQTGTLDLVPRFRSFLGLPTCQPLPGRPPGLQGADQRHGCPSPVGTRGGALSGPGRLPFHLPWRSRSIHWNRGQASLCSCLGFPQGLRPPLGVRNTTLHRKPSHWMGGLHPPTCDL